MFWTIIIILILIFLFILAVRARLILKRRRNIRSIENTVTSPASLAIGELAAIAGGIYLSLVLLQSFLELTIPDKITFLSMSLDPLAFAAVIIALLQPLFFLLYDKFFS